MSIRKDLESMLSAGVIDTETAERILKYYRQQGGNAGNRLIIAFGILGAVLVGLGVILILSHNWDQLSRSLKTLFAFLPLLIGQLLCGWVLLRQEGQVAWRESAAAFLFFAVGASISLISQIYHLPGDVSAYLLTWMLLCLPLVYLLRSSITSLLYLCGITYLAVEAGYWNWNGASVAADWYWLLLLCLLPYYYLLHRRAPNSNFTTFHHWLVPLSLLISLGIVAEEQGEWMFVAYISLFSGFCVLGRFPGLADRPLYNNGYRVLGSLGIVALLLTLSYDWFWQELRERETSLPEILGASEFYAAALLSLVAAAGLFFRLRRKASGPLALEEYVFVPFAIIFALGWSSTLAAVLINLLVFAIGLLKVVEGGRREHLGILNYGLLIIAALAACRFFDQDISFLWRGLIFLLIGISFFGANYWIIRKRAKATTETSS